MSSNLSVKKSTLPDTSFMQQTGTNNFNVMNQEYGTVNFNITYQQGVPANSAEMMMAIQSFSTEYYQLIITCEEDVFANSMVAVLTSQALTKYNVPAEIFERCSTLSDAGIEELKRIPAIICLENTELNGVTDPNQRAMYAYIKKCVWQEKIYRLSLIPSLLFSNKSCAINAMLYFLI